NDCPPIKIVTLQAIGERHNLIRFSDSTSTSMEARLIFICGSQMAKATKTRSAQIHNAPVQPIPSIDDIGTLKPDPKAPNTFINTAYNPVINPIFKRKLIFKNAQMSTFDIAIARPI